MNLITLVTWLIITAHIQANPASAATPSAPSAPTVQAIIFDCDGVLVDSEGDKFEAWRETLAAHGVTLTKADYLKVVGRDSAAILAEFSKVKKVSLPARVIDAKEDAYHRRQRKGLRLIAPAVAFAKYLGAHKRELGVRLGLASSANVAEITENLRQAGLSDVFDDVSSGVDDLREIKDPNGVNKPAPYVYQAAARKLGIDPARVVVFEDSAAGVIAAHRAGMTVFAVPNAYTRGQNFEVAKRNIKLTDAPAKIVDSIFGSARPLRMPR